MDYNFNLKHESQKKFKMSFLQPPGFERCFSTSSKINVTPCSSGNLAVNPLNIMNFISGLHKQNPVLPNHSAPAASTMQSNPFSAASGVSVSCFVGGFVGTENQPQSSSEYCNGLLLDVLLNEISTLEKVVPKATSLNANSSKTIDKGKRTYAEVTREMPKRPAARGCFLKNVHEHCDKFTRLSGPPPTNQIMSEKILINRFKPYSEAEFDKMTRLSSSSSSSSSSGSCKRKNRTLSECSVDSDDSYIVFENEDEGTVFDFMEDESSDDSEEAEGRLTCPEGHSSNDGLPSTKTKKVTFKNDDKLVTVHLLSESECESRAGPWEQYARDRVRFQNRIKELSRTISPVLSSSHRHHIYNSRFITAP